MHAAVFFNFLQPPVSFRHPWICIHTQQPGPVSPPPPTPQPGSRHPPRDCECSPAPAPASKGEWSSGRPTFMTAGSTGLDRTMRFRPLNMLQRQ